MGRVCNKTPIVPPTGWPFANRPDIRLQNSKWLHSTNVKLKFQKPERLIDVQWDISRRRLASCGEGGRNLHGVTETQRLILPRAAGFCLGFRISKMSPSEVWTV